MAPSPDIPAPGDRQDGRAWLLGVLLVTLLAWLPSLANDFTMDDRFVALGQPVHDGEGNPKVRELRPIGEYFSSHYWDGHAASSRLFRPFTVLSFALRHAVFGDAARVAHLINVLLHVVATWLVWLLVRGLRAPPLAAAAAALVFGLHAVHSEAIAGIVGRAELLAFCGGAGGLLLLERARNARPADVVVSYAGAAAALFVAFGSKESALAWAAFVPVYGLARHVVEQPSSELLPAFRRTWICDALAILVPVLAFLWLRQRALAGLPPDETVTHVVNPIFDAPAGTRVATALLVQGRALLVSLLPFRLAADYGAVVFPVAGGFASPHRVVALAVLLVALALVAFAVRSWRKRPLPALGVATFFGFGFVTSNLAFPIGTIFGERLLYAPSLGVALAAAWLAPRLERGAWRLPARIACGAWLGACVLTGVERQRVWQDDATLFTTEAARCPSSVRMQVCAGAVHRRAGRLEHALVHLQRAVALDPGYADAWNHLGVCLMNLDRHDEAVQALRAGLDQARPRERDRIAHQLHANAGLALARLGHPADAITAFEAAHGCDSTFLRSSREAGELLASIVHDPSVDRALRERAARLGLAAFGPAGPPR